MTCETILQLLREQANPENVAGMARFGIKPQNALGTGIPFLRRLARQIGRDHELAGELWKADIHEARVLAAYVDLPAQVTLEQMERWVRDFDSWDVCDQVCGNLFDRTPYAYQKANEWARRDAEFVRRAGFVLMASLAVHDKSASDAAFLEFLPLIETYASDSRNFVKKAVNWALRQIGKRNAALRMAATLTAQELAASPIASCRWVGKDALREFERIPVKP